MVALHSVLCQVLKAPFPDGEDHCYFEPPANKQIHYPCIVYKYENDEDDFADNIRYRTSKRYTVTIIDEDPDSEIPMRLKDRFPYCTSEGNRNFVVDGLRHFVYTLFYSGPRVINKEGDNNGEN